MIPKYVEQSWDGYMSGCFWLREIKYWSELLRMNLDPSRPPFIFAGNLEDKITPKRLTFGLAPHGREAPDAEMK